MKGTKRYERKRWISGFLVAVMIFGLILNQPMATWSYPASSGAAASASDAVRDTKVTFAGRSTEDVEIAVLSDESGYEAGDVICLDLYIKNNTDQTITDGLLKYRGSGILEDSAFFEDVSDLYIEETEASGKGSAAEDKADITEAAEIVNTEVAETGIAEAVETNSTVEEGIYSKPEDQTEHDEEITNEEAIKSDEEKEPDEENEDGGNNEDDPKRLTDLTIHPGQSYFVNFYFTIDDTIEGIKGQNISFNFRGTAGDKTVRAEQTFRYVIGAMNLLPVELGKEGTFEIGEKGEMLLDFDLGDLEDMIQEAEMEEEAEREEAAASPSNGKKDSGSNRIASRSQAITSSQARNSGRGKTASHSQIDGSSDQENKIASSSNAWIQWEEAPSQQSSKKKEEHPLVDHLKLQVETQGVKLKEVKLSHDTAEDEDDKYGTSSVCSFQVDGDAEPGVYYGQVTASYQVKNKKFRSTQGFILTVIQIQDEQVAEIISLIDALPGQEEISENIAAYEMAEDEDGYDQYLMDLSQQVIAVYQKYLELSEEQQEKVTNRDKLMDLEWIWSVKTLETDFSVLTADKARISGIAVTGISDGVAPWDDNDQAGNDSGNQNKIVRTFDSVTYNFEAQMESYDNTSYSEARVKLEFVLPLTAEQAVFDQAAMAWMDHAAGYEPKLTTETRTIDGKDTQCQVLTCYKRLLPSEGHQSVVPGAFGENVTVNVKSMKNGETFAPIFSAAMEHGTWEGDCTTHKKQERYTIKADDVKVSAAPKYNIQIGGQSSYKSTFDFNSGNEIAKDYGEGYNKGQVVGRVMKVGIILQLYNNNASKGLKGIELPDGSPITFDLSLWSQYKINQPNAGSNYIQGQKIDLNDKGYLPLLWSCDENKLTASGGTNDDGRVLYDSHGCAQNFAPCNRGYKNAESNACHNGGTWRATQQDGVIHVTVSGYQIDVDKMPLHNVDGSNTYGVDLGIGCFSAGEIWIVQPYNKVGSTGTNPGPDYDVVQDFGEGAFTLTVRDKNMKAATVSGATFQDPDGTSDAQTKKDDDRIAPTLELTLPGSLQNRVGYGNYDNVLGKGVGIANQYNGLDFATVGTKLHLIGGFSYSPQNEEDNILYWGTNLTKFYGSAIEVTEDSKPGYTGEGWGCSFTDGASLPGGGESISILYATKKDGTDWSSDDELKNTYEDSLVFYDSLSEIPKGHLCVGMLFCFKGPGPLEGASPYYFAFHTAKVRDNMELSGKTFMLASTSRVWTKSMFEEAGMTLESIPDWTNSNTGLSSFPAGYLKSANIAGSTWYTKETYAADGSGALGTHNSDWRHWGDTLLVIGYKSEITKNLAQQSDSVDKNVYNLDAEQRVVDFKLQPYTKYDQGSDNHALTTTVTIIDTLPKYLTYRPGSSYFGGTYVQTSVNGGTQGTITGGTLREPDSIVSNEDGTQILTWVIPNVTVGEEIPKIYYSADIGNRNNPDKDVPIGTTNLVNKVRITATHDLRQPSFENRNYAESGIAVTRGTASSFGKYSKQKLVEPDGVIDYVVYFNNNAVTGANVVLLDTMPYDEVNGSTFTGTYTVNSWKLDVSKCDPSKLTIWYTMNEEYKAATTASLGGSEAAKNKIQTDSSWKKVTIGADGVIKDFNGQKPIAWAIIGSLDANKSVYVDMQIQLQPGQSAGENKIENNYYVNTLSNGDTTITTENPTVNRILEGLTWMDDSKDGIQNEDAGRRISGVKVTLMKLKAGGSPNKETDYEPYHYQGDPLKPVVQIETGKAVSVRADSSDRASDYEQGRYKFIDLPAGTFAVKFEDGNTTISTFIASPDNQGSDDTMDSDGMAVYSSNHVMLERAMILNIDMPAAENMNVILYESKYHDSGFYEKGPELPETGGCGTFKYTFSGIALMAFALVYDRLRRRRRSIA